MKSKQKMDENKNEFNLSSVLSENILIDNIFDFEEDSEMDLMKSNVNNTSSEEVMTESNQQMDQKSNHLLTVLRKNSLIDSKTIDSLIKYGFDSNQTLLSMIDSDLRQMSDINHIQKLVLRKVLNDISSKIFDTNSVRFDINEDSEMNDNESDVNYDSVEEPMAESNQQLESVINEYKNELSFKDMIIEKNEREIKCLKELIQKMANDSRQQFYVHSNNLMEMKNVFDINYNTIEEKNNLANNNSTNDSNMTRVSTLNEFKRESNEKPINKSINKLKNSLKSVPKKSSESIVSYIRYKCLTNDCNQTFLGLKDIQKHIRLMHNKNDKQFKDEKEGNNRENNTLIMCYSKKSGK